MLDHGDSGQLNMEATKPLSRVSSSQITSPSSSVKRKSSKSHCSRFMMPFPCEREIRIRIQRLKRHQGPRAVGCVAQDPGSVAELEKELEDEIKEGRLGEKSRGVVELLECLEKEAIMGEDQGRDPTDYNRRAQIFDKSSEVFQALKERGLQHYSNHQS